MGIVVKLAAMAAVLCLAAPVMAQTPAAPPARAAAPALPPFDGKTEMGEIDGATFRIDMPAKWNKGLVIMNHGYSPEPRKPAAGEPSARIRMFASKGYAVAQSSYSKGGWALEQAMTDNEKLRKYFVKKYGKTTSVFTTGGAMGAAVTMASMELYPDVYTGGLITCCGTMMPSIDAQGGSFRTLALFEYYFPGVLPPLVGPVNGFMYGGASDEKVRKALAEHPAAAEIVRRTTQRRLEDLPNHLTFQTYIVHEMQERAGGNPFDNSTYVYVVDDDPAKVNAGVKRYVADPKAMAYTMKWYTATGKLKKPMFLMSVVYDPVVNISNTTGYVDLVRKAGYDKNIVLQWYDHEGHGGVSAGEVEAAFDALVAWSKGGPKPPTGDGKEIGTARGGMAVGGAPPRAGAAGAGQ